MTQTFQHFMNKGGRPSSLLQTNAEDFYARKIIFIEIFYLPVTHMSQFFPVLTSPNSTEITKPVLNNNTSMLFAMPSKIRKKRKNFKINRKDEDFKKFHKTGISSALSEDLEGLVTPFTSLPRYPTN